VSGCNFKYYSVFENGTVRKAVSYVADNGTFWTNDDNSSYPDSFGCTRFALESSGNYIYPACVSSSSGSSSNDNTTTSDNSTDNTSSSTPHPLNNISGLALWLDASNIDGDNNSSLSDDDAVSEWKDLSTHSSLKAIQEETGKQPRLKSSSLTYSVVNFDGVDDYLYGSYENSFLNDNISIFLVKRQDDNNAQNTFISTNEDLGFTRYDVTHWSSSENTIVYFRDQSDTSKHEDIFANSINDDFDIFYNEIDGDVSNTYINGALESTLHNVENNSNLNNYLIGKRPNNSVTLQGDIAELIIYERKITENERTEINSYLSSKWNLKSTVDSDGDGIVDASDPFPTDPSKWISFPQALRDNVSDNFTAMNGLAL